jgi:hypothetical protein
MRKLFLLLFFSILSIKNIAQINPGARQISIANSDVALANDVFTLFNNPAGLAQWIEDADNYKKLEIDNLRKANKVFGNYSQDEIKEFPT